MSRFVYPINLLSEERELLFHELTFKDYKEFNKVLVNDDNNALEYFVNSLLHEICIEDIDWKRISILDKAFILLFLYGINHTTTIPLSFTCPTTQKKFKAELDLVKITEMLQSLKIQFKKEVLFNRNYYRFTLPRDILVNPTPEDIFASCLEEIYFVVPDKSLPFYHLPLKQRRDFIKNVSTVVIKEVEAWLIEQNHIISAHDLINIASPHAENENIQFTPSLINRSLIEFVKIVFQDDLKAIYHTEYHFIRNLGFTLDNFSQLTPAEVIIYNQVESEKERPRPNLPPKPIVAK